MTQGTKQHLAGQLVATVGELAGAAELERSNWSLRTSAELFRARAKSLLDGRVVRLRDRYTYLMPPRFDWAVVLAADHDPMSGRLATLGALFDRDGGQESVTDVVTEDDELAERTALIHVLGRVIAFLSEADEANRRAGKPVYAHIFLYEPSEAEDMRRALERHLDAPEVRAGLLQMLRMFPPEEIPREPEYHGEHHLPATAIRSVVDSLYALPARVSHDLRPVSVALAAAEPPLPEPYHPASAFERPFSSRLSIDACSALRKGALDPQALRADVEFRLRTTLAVARWLAQENSRAESPFLRLRKRPFHFQQSFDPLRAGDIELLEAQELLARCSDRLARLIELSQPAEHRRARFRCLAGLECLAKEDAPDRWHAKRLWFRVPEESRHADVGPETLAVILHDDHPDHRLDSAVWETLAVDIASFEQDGGELRVVVDVPHSTWDGPRFQRLLAETPTGGFYLDLVHRDVNTPRVLAFLDHLARTP